MNKLQSCLQMQGAALAEYGQVLDDEARALEAGRFRHLPALMERKTELARQIAELDHEREVLQREMGFDPAGPARPGQEAFQQAWEQLRKSAIEAREGNHRNGVMVHTLLDFTRQAMAVMQDGSRPLYGQDGRHPGGGGGKSLARG